MKIWIRLAGLGLLIAGTFAFSSSLEVEWETDCHFAPRPLDVQNRSLSTVDFPFRADNITLEECLQYAAMTGPRPHNTPIWDKCSPLIVDSAEECTSTPEMYQKTYLNVGKCYWKDRDTLREIHRNVSMISPTRAVVVSLSPGQYMGSNVHFDVVDPVRQQIVGLTIEAPCDHNPNVTAMVYEMGNLPHILRFDINKCAFVNIRQRDFSRMPQLRMIYFYKTAVGDMEPYTFTDIPHLQVLALETGLLDELDFIRVNETDPQHYARFHVSYEEKEERIRQLHCSCSYAWFRNFLKEKPFLTASKREEGEVFRLGDFASPSVPPEFAPDYREMLSVDCSKPLTYENAHNGTEFSVNTTCCNLTCRTIGGQ
ncbi:uncharacterized protein LOC129592472 [Paramacrobiotus metropolitanus]|uniref:uncharacterized protein LOC129592472 n=1 Tax=Paramacrobiotus metropolitanus TaxID=2943436 RepID=UPI0024460533|nr:uncharacterized protein LOC129592472 [Paramacrobiotus metropolitanus]